MNVKALGSFPPDSNPFNHDLYHMGTEIGKNVIVMYANHPGEQCDYLIVVNRETGERMQELDDVEIAGGSTPAPQGKAPNNSVDEKSGWGEGNFLVGMVYEPDTTSTKVQF